MPTPPARAQPTDQSIPMRNRDDTASTSQAQPSTGQREAIDDTLTWRDLITPWKFLGFGRPQQQRSDVPIPSTEGQITTPTSTIDPDPFPRDELLKHEIEASISALTRILNRYENDGPFLHRKQRKLLSKAIIDLRDRIAEYRQRASCQPNSRLELVAISSSSSTS